MTSPRCDVKVICDYEYILYDKLFQNQNRNKCRNNLELCSAQSSMKWSWCGTSGFFADSCSLYTNVKTWTSAEQHETISHYKHTGRCSLSLSKSGVWYIYIIFWKCWEVQIITYLKTPCNGANCVLSKHAATGTRSRGWGFATDLVPKGAQMGGRIFDCQWNPFQTFCLVALCVHS